MRKIRSIQAWVLCVPLLEEWAASPEFGPHVAEAPRLILDLEDEEGFSGWGEGPANLRGTSLRDSLVLLANTSPVAWRPAFLDLHPTPTYWQEPHQPGSPYRPQPARLRHRLRHPLQCAVETALLDLTARRAGVPLAQFFGGAWRDRVPVDYWMGRETPERSRACVRRALQLGFRGIKLKAALEDPNVERLEAIKEEAGPEFGVTVDPNGRFYRPDEARATILAMDAVGNLRVLEDPFPRHHPGGSCAGLHGKIRARLVAHLDPPEALTAVLLQGQIGGLNIDSHTQGLWGWRLQAAAADTFNLPVWHGSGLDLGIATAAQLHVAAATPNCELAGDQVGPWLRQASLLKNSLRVENGAILLPEGPGLGIEVDRDQIENHTLEHFSLKS
jgi:L-alanine-DL-glutamate epimerase-like enolase superfamily enzyme